MKVRLKIVTPLCLLALVAAWYFWPRTVNVTPVVQKISAPVASAPVAPVTASTNVVAADAGKLSAAATNRLAYRLANTTKSIRELSTDSHAVLLENAFIDTQAKLDLKIPTHLKAANEPGAFIVQSRGVIDAGFRAAIAGAGGKIVSYIPNNAFLVQLSAAGAAVLTENFRVQAVLPYEPYYKVQSTLLGLAVNQKPLPAGTYLTLGLFGDGAAAIADAEKLGAKILARDRSPFGSLVRVQPPADWIALANLPGVQLVEPAYRRQAANDLSRVAVGVSTNTSDGATNNYLGLTGKNVLVEVNDTGVDPDHPDLTGRVFSDSGGSLLDTDGHGTHVAGIIAGDGTESFTVTNARGSVTNANFRGKAPAAMLFAVGGIDGGNDTNFLTDDSYLQETPALTNALISNNSWGYGGDTTYDLAAASYDAAVRDALPETTGPQPVLFVFAAGNDGGGNDSGSGGVADSVSSPGTAKNVVTVGALEELRNITNVVTAIDGTSNAIWSAATDSGFQVARYSSRGNVGVQTEGDFGRFKPDVVAPGTFAISTRSTNWDQQKYYNRTNYHQTVFGDFVTTNTLAYGFMTVPQNAVGVTIQVVPTSGSTNYPIYVSISGVPDPTDNTTYDFFKTNGFVSIPPDSGGLIGSISDLQNGGLIYAVGDPSTNESLSFNVIETIITTNDLGNELEVLSNLNNTISPYYRYESGTSMATPVVSGVLALMQDFFTNTLHTTPSPALLKAMTINGARLTGNYKFAVTNTLNYEGWGLVKLPNSIPSALTNTSPSGTNGIPLYFVDQSPTNTVATGDSRTWNVSVSSIAARQQPLRVTLAWTDPPGNPAAAIKLVNDLDLIVTNLDSGEVFYGNQFAGNGTPPFSAVGNSNSIADNINNVENVFLAPALGTNYSITVFGHAVNVNAVTIEQTNIVQDFALVVSCGDGSNSNGFTVASSAATLSVIAPFVDYLPATNGIYFNQFAGANAPWLSTNDVNFGVNNPYSFFTNSVFHAGQNNQWHFYIVTNTFVVTNSSFTNAAFIVFDPNTAAIPREGVFGGSAANSTRPEADFDLLVATAPLATAGALTNLDLGVISNCLFGANGCASAIGRGGTEFVAFTNSQPNQIYYIGVQCQDQMAGQFGFIPVFSDQPFSTQDTNGNVYVHGINMPVNIPDGNNAHPGVGYVFGLALQPIEVKRVIVTNTFTHENFGDLFGAVSHGGQYSVLNNHDGLGPVDPTQLFIYDDSVNGGTANSMHSDGPGSLNNFRGKQGIGLWQLTEVDNSFSQTGSVAGFQMKIEPHRDLRHQPFAIVTVPAGGWFYDYVDVPAGYTNLLVLATNITSVPVLTPPVELFVKEGDLPTVTDTNYSAFLANGTPPGCSVSVGPPLVPDRYFVGLYNASGSDQTVLIGAQLSFSSSAIVTADFPSQGGVVNILDDAVTYDSVFVTSTQAVQNFNVGLRVDHSRISDLVFHLITPDSTRYLLMENRGGQTTNGCGVTILTTNLINATAKGNALADTNTFNVGVTHGSFPITYNFYTEPDEMTVYYGTNVNPAYLIYDTGLTNNPPLGPGAQNTQPETFVVNFPPAGVSADSTYLTIVMNQYGNTNRQTAWTYTAGGVLTNYAYLTFTEDTNLTQTPIKFAVPPFIPQTTTNIYYSTNFSYTTNLAAVTNLVYTTNITYVTNVNLIATNYVLSGFETSTVATWGLNTTVDGWTVASNQVDVVSDPTNAAAGSRLLTLATGSIKRSLPTITGTTNAPTFQVSGLQPGMLLDAFSFSGFFAVTNIVPVATNVLVTTNVLPILPTNIPVLWGPVQYTNNNHYYCLFQTNTWTASEAWAVACGGHLTTINDAAEDAWIGNQFSLVGGVYRDMWIGLWDTNNDTSKTTTIHSAYFSWVNGEAAAYRNWRSGEPNNGGSAAPDAREYYAYKFAAGYAPYSSVSGVWNDFTNNIFDTGALYIAGVAELNSLPVIVSTNITYTTNIVVTTSNLCYLPEQDISGIQTINPYGLWKLEILDNRAGGGLTNSLVSWQLELQYANTNITVPPVLPTLATNYSIIESNLLVITNTATYWNTNATLLYTLAVSSGVTNATISTNGIISWTPTEDQGPGSYIFVTTVSDPANQLAVAQNFFQVDVLESNLPPAILFPTNNAVIRILETVPFLTNVIAYDPDIPTNTLTFGLAGFQNVSGPGISTNDFNIDPQFGTISWLPAETNGPSTNIVFITVTDTNPPAVNQTSFTVTNYFTVVVLESNLPPTLFLPPNTNIDELVPWSALATATDPDWPTNGLTFALVSGPAGMTVTANGVINWTPSEAQGPGVYTNYISVTDTNPWAVNQQSFSVTNFFIITVNEINLPPVLSGIPNTNVYELSTLTVPVSATDPDLPTNTLIYALSVTVDTNATIANGWSNSLAYATTNPPPVINPTNGVITWTPSETQGPAVYDVTVFVTDTNQYALTNQSYTVSTNFTITVLETNSAPFWTNGYPNVVMNVLQVTNVFGSATDTDLPPNILTYTLASNTPAWISINSNSGAITLAPGLANGPSTNTVTVVVTDNGTPPLSATTNFTVIVNGNFTIVTFGVNEGGVGIKYQNGALYLCGDSDPVTGGSGGFLASVALPLNASSVPLWNTNWPSAYQYDFLNGITADTNGIYSAGMNYTRTTDHAGGKEDKGLVVKFPLSGATGSGFGGDIWDTQTPPYPTYAFSYGGSEGLNAVTLASENGTNFIYTTGAGQDQGNGGRFFLSKLDESANVLWTKTDATGNGSAPFDGGYALTVMNTNIYAAGVANSQPYLRKYDPNGNLLFSVTDGSVSGQYYGVANALNYIYAVGYANVSGTNSDFLIDKWDESGNLIWSRTYDRATAQDQLKAAVNFNNRIFAVGFTYGQTVGGADAVVVEIDPLTGNLLSTNLFGGALDDKANGVDTDSTNLYVIGESDSYDNGTNQVMLFTFTPGTPNLAPGAPLTNVVAPGGINWFQVNVPTNAIAATNALIFATSPVNFWFSTNAPPSITNPGDFEFAANTSGTTNVIYTNGTPLLVPGGTYYLGVQNPNSIAVTNAVEVTFELAPPTLDEGVPATNTVPANSIFWHRVKVPSNAIGATNALIFATLPVDFWFSTNVPPSIINSGDVEFATNTIGTTNVIYTTGTPLLVPGGIYYLGVQNTNNVSVTYALQVTFEYPTTNVSIYSIVPTNSAGTNGFIITWFAPTNYQFHLQWTPSLAPTTWKEMKGVISFDSYVSATNSHFSFFDYGDTNRNSAPFGPTRFYRLHLLNSPTNTPPEFLSAPPLSFNAAVNQPFAYTDAARDWDIPAQVLNYFVTNSLADTNVAINSFNGALAWTPDSAEAGLTNHLAVWVKDNGTPVKGTTNTFAVVVYPQPAFGGITAVTNGVQMTWSASTNEQFQINWTTNLAPPVFWTPFPPPPVTSTTGAFSFLDTNAPFSMKFYELILLP